MDGVDTLGMETRKQVRLLVMGDEAFQKQLVESAELCSHQYDFFIRSAAPNEAAGSLLADFSPSVVLLNLDLASEAAELVRGCGELNVPLVVSSEFLSDEIESRARRQGAVACIVPNEDPDELEQVVHLLASVSGELYVQH